METKRINKKINFLSKNFKDNNYILSEKDIADLIIQLNRKPIQLYLKTIDVIKLNNKQSLTYENVSQMIKDDIKIRNNIRNIITPFEEAIRLEYIDKIIELGNIQKYLEFSKYSPKNPTLPSIINELKKEIYHEVRKIRNDVSHLSYPMIFGDLENILIKLNNIKNIDFVNEKTLNICIEKVNIIKGKWLK